jgi:UDP-N-acetylglucosamine:LPS N-acetylglucosamine transferase
LPDEEMAELIAGAGVIICRPGYSTLMDLVSLGRNAVLVPTPGQTEQEYLAASLSAAGTFSAMSQEHFSLDEALEAGEALRRVNPSVISLQLSYNRRIYPSEFRKKGKY